jgi:hypothetical protein
VRIGGRRCDARREERREIQRPGAGGLLAGGTKLADNPRPNGLRIATHSARGW